MLDSLVALNVGAGSWGSYRNVRFAVVSEMNGVRYGFEAVLDENATRAVVTAGLETAVPGTHLHDRVLDLACRLHTFPPQRPVDVSDQVEVRLGPVVYDRVERDYAVEAVLTNLGTEPLPSPVSLAVSLPWPHGLVNAAGDACAMEELIPCRNYVNVLTTGVWPPGGLLTRVLRFTADDSLSIETVVVAGPGYR